MSKSKSRKFADILSGNLATVLDDGIISASEVASLGTAATTDATAYATAAQGTTADNALPKSGGAMTGAITTNSTFDGRDVAIDGTKLDGIETGATADQTAAQILTAIKTVDGASSGLDADKLDGQEGSYYTSYVDTAIANLSDSAPETLNTLNELAAALGDDASFSTTVTNSIATKLPKAGGTMSGDIDGNGNKVLFANVYSSTGDLPSASTYHGMFAHVHGTGRGYFAHAGSWVALANASEISDENFTTADHSKLDGIEANADVTDTANVTSAGALMDSEVTNLSQVKAFDTTDYATAAQGTTADNALPKAGGTITGNVNFADDDRLIFGAGTDLQIYHNSSTNQSHITENTGGNLHIQGQEIRFLNSVGSHMLDIGANNIELLKNTDVTGNITISGTVDGRDVATDGTKLDTIETNADVTDTTNVVAALTAGTNVSIAANGTISSTDTNTTYSVGDGGLTQKNFTTTLKSKLDGIESGATGDQSASEISGLEEFVEDQIGANIIGGSNVSVSYNDSTGQTTLSSTDTNTTYSAGGGLGLSGTTFSHNDTSSQASVNNSGRTYIQDITLDTYGHITAISSATETVVNTNTTYSVGDGGLTQKNFTSTLKTKLDGIATSANNYSHPTGNGNNHIPSGGSSGQILGYSSAGTAQWTTAGGGLPEPVNWGSPQHNFTSGSGSWSVPSSIGDDVFVTFYLVGGGAGGTKEGANNKGGGGGCAAVFNIKKKHLPSSISYSIGTGGQGSYWYLGGGNGGKTTCTVSGRTHVALGGQSQNTQTQTRLQGTNQMISSGDISLIGAEIPTFAGGTVYYSGGSYVDNTGDERRNSVFGGGCGGFRISATQYGNGTSTYAGNGGAGGGVSTGSAGQAPGGGGGGSGSNGGDGGDGANGSLRIYY